MKKFLGLLAVVCSPLSLWACDVCGTSGAASLSLLNPAQRRSLIALQFNYSRFESRHQPSILQAKEGQHLRSEEQFFVPSLAARLSWNKNWQWTVQAPYQHFTKQDADGRLTYSGMGDIWTGVSRVILRDSLRKSLGLMVSADVSLKLPAGSFRYDASDARSGRQMLPGTGNWDQLIQVSAALSGKAWNLSTASGYTLTGKKGDLSWGDRFFGQVEYQRRLWRKTGFQLNGQLAWFYEWAGADQQRGIHIPYSGYQLHQAKVGVQGSWKNWNTSLNWFQPLAGQLADGQVKLRARTSLQIIYFLSR